MTNPNPVETASATPEVRHFIAKFVGRTKGAIGKFYPITAKTSGVDREQAILNLYDRYEHISQLELTDTFNS